MSELLTRPEFTTPLSDIELERFKDICLTHTEEQSVPAICNLVASCGYDVQRAPYGGMEPNWPRITARNCSIWGAGPLESIYNDAQPDECTAIIAHDIAGWNALYKMTYELSPGHPNIQTGLFEYDRRRAFTYVLPHNINESRELINAYSFPEVNMSEFNTMPQLVDRFTNGMPREAQLLLIATTLPGIRKSDSDMLQYDAFRTSVLCNELQISPEELSTVYTIIESAYPDRVTDLRLAILQNTDIQLLLDAEHLSTRDRLLGTPEILGDALRVLFSYYVLKGNQDSITSWRNACSVLGDETVDEYLSQYERTVLLHSHILKQLVDPHRVPLRVHPSLHQFIDAQKLAEECSAMLNISLSNPIQNTHTQSPSSVAHTLEETLGISLQTEILRYSEYPYSKQIEAVITYADEQSDIYREAVNKRDETYQYDPIMRRLLSQYAKLQNDESLSRLGQGYSYDDDPDWFDAREIRQQAVKSQLRVLESLIAQRASNI